MSGATAVQHDGEEEVHDLFGVAHRILVASEQIGGAAAVVEITIPPGAGSVPHTNQREALAWYVIDGVVDFETEEGPRTLEPGGALFMVRHSRHRFANIGDRPARALMIALPGGIEAFFREAASALRTTLPTAPPSPETVEAFAQVAARYGIELHTESIPA
jgi:quercetin dioxygenase-like cupin family protein